MQITLTRTWPSLTATLGSLDIDGVFQCYTLERRDVQIPEGTYPVTIQYSPKFQRNMPHIDDVPGRTAIEIHWGNYIEDTDGCVLVGEHKIDADFIGNSIKAFNELYAKLETVIGEPMSVIITSKETVNDQ